MWWWMLACGGAVSIEQGPPMQGVEIVAGVEREALVLTLAGAWLDDDGSGHGTDAAAVLPGPPELKIEGERSTWSMAEGTFVFEESVKATRGPVTLYCDKLDVDYVDDRVQEARAQGNVRVVRGDRVATALEALLTVADGRLVLEGEAVLEEGPHRLTGDRVILWLDQDRASCEGCVLSVAGEAVAPTEP